MWRRRHCPCGHRLSTIEHTTNLECPATEAAKAEGRDLASQLKPEPNHETSDD
jgi:transcriptional regulator NrdR family protein